MKTDIVLDETIEFIRSTSQNVKLAIAVEEAMRELRTRVYGSLMSALQDHLKRSKTTWQITPVYPGKRTQGEPPLYEGIRLHRKTGWTSKGKWGGVWIAKYEDPGVVQIGVTGIPGASETIKDALAHEFQALHAGVRRDEDQIHVDVVQQECLLAKSDDQIREFASEVAKQMMHLVQTIKSIERTSASASV